MQFIPVKTKILNPPQDDLYSMLDKFLPIIKEEDVILISSKLVAIHQGRCLPIEGNDKLALIEKEADFIVPRPYWTVPIAVVHHAFLGSAGIDESNGAGYYILMPKDIFVFAKELHNYLCQKYSITKLGVVITDSRSSPFRYGATGIALSWWGFNPVEDHRGRKDLFGREIKYERSNLVDGLASGAVVVSGEVDECVPVVIARDIPRIVFNSSNTEADLMVPYTQDTFRVLYEKFIPKD